MDSKDALFLHQSLSDFPVMIWKWNIAADTFRTSAGVANSLDTPLFSMDLPFNEWIGHTHPLDQQKLLNLRKDVLCRRKEIFSETFRLRNCEGNWRWVMSQGEVTARDERGMPVEVTGITIDQTRQMRTEEFARQSRLNLTSFFDTLDDIVFVCDRGGILVTVNLPPLAVEIFGKTWSRGEKLEDLFRARGTSEDSLTQLLSEDPAMISVSLTDQAGQTRFLEVKTRLGTWEGEPAFFGICHDFTERKKALVELSLRREQLELALDGAEEGLWDYNISNKTFTLDERAAAITEMEPDTHLDFATCRKRVHPHDVERVAALLRAHEQGKKPFFTAEYRIIFAGNRTKWLLQRGRICRRNNEGNPLQMMGTLMDISDQKKEEEARLALQKKLAESEERLTLALEATQEGLWDWDLKKDTVFISNHWVEMLGYTREDIPDSAKVLFGIMHPEDKEEARIKLHRHLKGETPFYEAEFRALTKGGEWKWIVSRGKVVSHDPEENPLRIIGTHTDISGRISAQKKIGELETRLREASSLDGLTGVLNRQAFRRILRREADRSIRCVTPLCIILINFDHFNHINSQYGHQAGDTLLIEAGQRISQKIRTSDVLARWSGEEFIVLTPGKLRGALSLAEKLSLTIENEAFPDLPDVTASFGVAAYRAGEKLEDLIQRVDIALYKAKKNGGNQVASQE